MFVLNICNIKIGYKKIFFYKKLYMSNFLRPIELNQHTTNHEPTLLRNVAFTTNCPGWDCTNASANHCKSGGRWYTCEYCPHCSHGKKRWVKSCDPNNTHDYCYHRETNTMGQTGASHCPSLWSAWFQQGCSR